jgi:hypothetical protein
MFEFRIEPAASNECVDGAHWIGESRSFSRTPSQGIFPHVQTADRLSVFAAADRRARDGHHNSCGHGP